MAGTTISKLPPNTNLNPVSRHSLATRPYSFKSNRGTARRKVRKSKTDIAPVKVVGQISAVRQINEINKNA